MAKSSFKENVQKATDAISPITTMMQPFPNMRMAGGITNRSEQVMTWRLPNGSTVQMYINPQSLDIVETKQVTHTRTKGGFVVQYWGDNPVQLTLSGNTGSAGIAGINVLHDIYRAEQSAFDLVALSQLGEVQQILQKANTSSTTNVAEQLIDASRTIQKNNFLMRPSLASLATSIILFYQGIQYKGFFTEFRTGENTNELGLFSYTITFMAVEVRGRRKNFMAWHKDPVAADPAGQLFGQILNGVGNSLRRSVGLSDQAAEPTQYHPEDAPLTFGGNTMAAELGVGGAVPPDYRPIKEFP